MAGGEPALPGGRWGGVIGWVNTSKACEIHGAHVLNLVEMGWAGRFGEPPMGLLERAESYTHDQ